MSLPAADSLRELLEILKQKYLEDAEQDGGTADGFRDHISKLYRDGTVKFTALVFQALMEAATRCWQRPPRKRGPDLFSIASVVIPETLTRPAGFATSEDIEEDHEQKFEKVSHKFATVADLYDDATITLRKGAQTSAAGEKKMQAADEARRRAGGDMSKFLKDLAD